jgi:hypothetical protein
LCRRSFVLYTVQANQNRNRSWSTGRGRKKAKGRAQRRRPKGARKGREEAGAYPKLFRWQFLQNGSKLCSTRLPASSLLPQPPHFRQGLWYGLDDHRVRNASARSLSSALIDERGEAYFPTRSISDLSVIDGRLAERTEHSMKRGGRRWEEEEESKGSTKLCLFNTSSIITMGGSPWSLCGSLCSCSKSLEANGS